MDINESLCFILFLSIAVIVELESLVWVKNEKDLKYLE